MSLKKYLLLLLLFVVTVKVAAQTPQTGDVSQIMQYYQAAKAAGMSDMQIEQAAMQRGFSLTDIAKIRQQVGQGGASGAMMNLGFDADTTVGRRQNGTLTTKAMELKAARDSILRFKEALMGLKDSLPGEKGVHIFGSTTFGNDNLKFEANLRISTPSNYQLGPDDELNVDISGNTSAAYRGKISPEGTFKMKDFTPVYVNGLTVEQARDRIIARLREGFSSIGRGVWVTVTLGNIRSIKVTITGEARKPGTYTVSSLNTAFNAFYLCGGPNANGSFRNIKIIRSGKVIRSIDLYDYLVKGDQLDNILLHDQDIIHIPFRGARVQTVGELNRKMIFEMKDNETLADLLRFAGGFADQAYKASLNVKRMNDKEQEILTIEQAEYNGFKLKSGDRINVGKILLNRFSNRVVVSGAVFRPGEYSLGSSIKTVKDLIIKAEGLREDAFTRRAFIHRRKANLEAEILPIAIGNILSGEAEDVPLRNRDSIFVRAIHELRERYYVTIYGEVNQGGDAEYEENMTVSDLVAIAKGLKEGAIGSRIEIARRITDNTNTQNTEITTEIIELKIDKGLSINPNDAMFKLKPFDIVYIRKSPTYQHQQSVFVNGEINYPGVYAIVNNSERISDLLARAGGVRSSGYLQGASFYRKKNRIAIDIERIATNASLEGNLLLENGDSLYIPKRSETVQILGEVLNPSFINYNKGYVFNDYLSQAGGYSTKALRRRAFVTYANGYTTRTRNFLFFKTTPRIEPGAIITVPAKPVSTKVDLPLGVLLGFLSPIIVATLTLLKTN